MALSEYEKQILAEMEQHLRQQDPDLADAMAQAAPPAVEPVAPKSQLSPRRIALGSILAAAGLAIVLTGVTIGFSVLSVVFGGCAAPELAKRIVDAKPKVMRSASCGWFACLFCTAGCALFSRLIIPSPTFSHFERPWPFP